MTNYTINTNHQFNSLEITFNDKPMVDYFNCYFYDFYYIQQRGAVLF